MGRTTSSIPHVWPQWKLLPRRIAQIVKSYSGEGGKPRWARVHHYEGRTSAMDCIDPNLRAAVAKKTREELDLANLRGKFTVVGGKVAQPQVLGMVLPEKEHLPPRSGPSETADPRPGGSDAMTVNQASGSGTTVGRIKSLKDGYGVVLDTLFPLPLVCELGRRP